MKIKLYTTWGNIKAQRVVNCETVDIVQNEIHVVYDGWRTPLAQYVDGYWCSLTNPQERKYQHLEFCP